MMFLWIRQPEQVKQQFIPQIKILIQTYYKGLKQEVPKRNTLEYVSVGEKVMFGLWIRKWKEAVAKRKRLEYISVWKEVEFIL